MRVLKLAIEFVEAEIITRADIRAMLAEKGATFDESEPDGESRAAVNGHLILAVNPEENLNSVIERVKESYIRHHLKNKSLRGLSKESGLSRKMMRRFADKSPFGIDYSQQQL